MITLKLTGGLGNQIFEYCFIRSLSYELNKEFYIDISYYKHGLARHVLYGLNSYNIKGNIGFYPFINLPLPKTLLNLIYRIFDIPLIKNNMILGTVNLYLKNNTEYNYKFIFEEPEIFTSDKIISKDFYSFKDIKTPAYFKGHFQFNNDSKNRLFITEKFFNKHLDLIHNDLKYMLPLTETSKNIAEKMDESNSILLHVRHGDYEGLLDFGLCSEEYYEKAINTIASMVENPKFFIFSDDIEGAKKLKIKYPHVFVDFEENTELPARGNGELLKLMSCCKHFIIANSTLSWWAAFLSENENKIIITPEPWFQSRRVLGVETIDNKMTITIPNNERKKFKESKNLIFKLDEENSKFKNMEYTKVDNGYKIKNLNKHSEILLNNNKQYNNRLIIKISLKSNHFDCFRILFKTKNNNKYCPENTFNIYYYEDDDFDQYLIFPKDTIFNEIKILPGKYYNKNDYLIIKSLEIKELKR